MNNPAIAPTSTRSHSFGSGTRAIDAPSDEDKPPLFLPNRAAYRRLAKGVKTRRRKAARWAALVGPSSPELAVLFNNLAEGADRDLAILQEARA